MKVLSALRKNYWLIALFLLLGVGYVWLSLITPTDRPVLAEAHLSHAQIVILILAVILPYISIWLVGLVGYIRLHDYAALIRKTPDGQPLKRIATSVLGVLVSLPLMSIANSTAQVLQGHHINAATQVRLVGVYAVVLLLMVSFYVLMKSTNALLAQTGQTYRYVPPAIALTVMALGGLYVYFVLTNPLFENGPVAGHLPAWLVMDTIVLPRLLAWYWGINAVWNLYQYAKIVKGKIYRLAFNYVALGLGVVMVMIILLQYLQAVSYVATLPIGAILLLVYLLLILASAGFMLVARGGNELAKIEEV